MPKIDYKVSNTQKEIKKKVEKASKKKGKKNIMKIE